MKEITLYTNMPCNSFSAGGNAQLASIGHWPAFILAAVAGFLTPLSYNFYQPGKNIIVRVTKKG